MLCFFSLDYMSKYLSSYPWDSVSMIKCPARKGDERMLSTGPGLHFAGSRTTGSLTNSGQSPESSKRQLEACVHSLTRYDLDI